MAIINFDYPAVGFLFEVQFNGGIFAKSETHFSEVSGISFQLNTEEIVEGGENRFKHRLPLQASYPTLILKRGITKKNSEFSKWVHEFMQSGLSGKLETKDINVTLLTNSPKGSPIPYIPLMSWKFEGAYPTKVEVSNLKSDGNELAFETIELAYRFFTKD